MNILLLMFPVSTYNFRNVKQEDYLFASNTLLFVSLTIGLYLMYILFKKVKRYF